MIQSYWHRDLLPSVVTDSSRSKSSNVRVIFLPGGALMVQVQEWRWAKLFGYPGLWITPSVPSISPPHSNNTYFKISSDLPLQTFDTGIDSQHKSILILLIAVTVEHNSCIASETVHARSAASATECSQHWSCYIVLLNLKIIWTSAVHHVG